MRRGETRAGLRFPIPGWVRRPAWWLAAVMSVGALSGYLLVPVAQAAGDVPAKTAQAFSGTTAVGALFTVVNGKLVAHFCTASVVHSKAENLLITAAHCVYSNGPPPAGSVVFVPGYHSGKEPRGVWIVTTVYVDSAWALHRSVNNDVAFLIAGRPGTRIERHTGAETLGIDKPGQQVQVIGYPDTTNRPITCTAPARVFGTDPHQLVFNCNGYTSGTSGGPFLAHVNARTGDGTVIGVIGGWQAGGNSPNVSYSARFFTNVKDLYAEATSGKLPPASSQTSDAGSGCPSNAALC
jgi:V8-like Glu-specific endopeptidase